MKQTGIAGENAVYPTRAVAVRAGDGLMRIAFGLSYIDDKICEPCGLFLWKKWKLHKADRVTGKG
ncbi:MAG: hypothetical protein OXH59_12795 [Rhodospirillaceae bacterium]|nr:hypothetical protein [Rhodospirillaceae bacterium]